MSFNRTLFATLGVSAFLLSCSMNEGEGKITDSDNLVHVGDTLPRFTVTMHDGTTLSSSALKGKPSLILFFSTTCPDCQRELPHINKRYLAHGEDTTFVAIAREQSDKEVTDYWTKNFLTLPYSAQTDRAVYSLFARQGIPRIYIVSPHGVVQRHTP